MADIIFEDYTLEVLGAVDDKINAALEECAGELEAATKRRCRVDTGQTKNAWVHTVDDAAHIATIGNTLENAIWEEFGTGEYALAGNGRKGGWRYKDVNGDWHFTYGKKPRRSFFNAYTSMKKKIIARMQESLKGL